MTRRSALNAGLVLATAALLAAPAAASPVDAADARISNVGYTDTGLELTYSAPGLPSGTGLDPETMTAEFVPEVGGAAFSLDVDAVAAEGAAIQQRVVLVLDTSGSLSDDDVVALREAANSLVDQLPEQAEVGLVTFGQPAVTVLDPTTDRAALRAELDELDDVGNTALFDAVILGTEMLRGEGSESIVLMTDGQDEGDGPGTIGSEATLDEAAASVAASGTRLTAVAFGDAATEPLEQLVAASGGSGVVPADDGPALVQALQDIGEDLATELAVAVSVPESIRTTSGVLTLSATAGDVDTTATWEGRLGPDAPAPTPTPTATPEPEPSPEPSEAVVVAPPSASQLGFLGPVALYIALGALFLALLIVALVLVGLAASRNSPAAVRERSLQVYSVHGSQPALVEQERSSTRLGDNAVARTAVEYAGRVVDKRQSGDRLGRRLDAAGIPLRPAEWVVIHTVSTIGGGLLLLLLSRGNILGLVLGLVIGYLVPRFLVSFRRDRRERAFLNVLPDTLGLMASGLRAGYSMPQAMDSVAREGQEPVKSEFNRALVEARLGVPAEEALEGIAHRMDSQDFRWVVMAIRIQREVGGNLAELLDTVSGTLRERARLKRQVLALSAEGRLSAWILGGLPVLFAAYLVLVQGDYVSTLWTEPLGIALSLVAIVLFVIGLFGLRWATKVDV
ncbi:type II secretion system F family protein [Aquipuribacter sp. SD81]|uniref:type II secretion system F family protein n=1 Tax=Aquipuribacter sp. SD81 TaxID=3127703 RepID=UPI003018628D